MPRLISGPRRRTAEQVPRTVRHWAEPDSAGLQQGAEQGEREGCP